MQPEVSHRDSTCFMSLLISSAGVKHILLGNLENDASIKNSKACNDIKNQFYSYFLPT